MNGEHVFEIVERIFFDRHDRAVVAGVVDENIDAPKAVARFGEDPRAVVGAVRTAPVGRGL